MTKTKQEPDYRTFTNRGTSFELVDEKDKRLKAELNAYRKDNPKPWYLGGVSPNADRTCQ